MTPDPLRRQTGSVRIGARQAERLLQLAAGYVTIGAATDPYKTLRAKGLVEDREGANGRMLPAVTQAGVASLRAFVERNGRLEVELLAPFAIHTTVLRLDPKED